MEIDMVDVEGLDPTGRRYRTQDIVVDANNAGGTPQLPIAADEYVEVTASGTWSTHPRNGQPSFNGPAGNGIRMGSGFESDLLVRANRGSIPMEIQRFSTDTAIVTVRGPCKLSFVARDYPKKYDDNVGAIIAHLKIFF